MFKHTASPPGFLAISCPIMTKAQKIASDPVHSVWVSASAGTGKTKVLTDRVLRLLLGGVKPGKILCLTFTNAAAAEMANRINKELGKWVTLPDDELARQIMALTAKTPDSEIISRARELFTLVLDSPDGLKIQTIHSFCQNLMRRFPLEANIAPHFQVIDEYTSVELIKEARIRLLIEKDTHSPEVQNALKEIAWQIHEGSFTALLQEVMQQRGKIEYLLHKYPPNEIIRQIYDKLGVKHGDSEEEIIDSAYSDNDRKNLKEAVEILLQGKKTDIDRGTIIAGWLTGDTSFAEYKYAFITRAEQKPVASVATKAIADKHPVIFELLLREQEKVAKLDDKIKSVKVARLSANLFHISEAILSLYKKYKGTRAYLDYNDLIHTSDKLLHHSGIAPWILYKLDGGIDHILVDEAQDTSPEQWHIIEAMCEEFFSGNNEGKEERTVFVVGDEKQSIFSFQGADPLVFNKIHNLFAKRIRDIGKSWQSVSLDTSFRSTEPVLQCVDKVFADEKLKQAITFSGEVINHKAHRNGHAGKVEVWPVIEADKNEELQAWEMPSLRRRNHRPARIMADKIAATIRKWLDEGRMLKSKGRKIRAGDIMILVRRRNELVDHLVHSLKASNINVAGVDRMVLTQHIAIEDLIALGNFLLLPEDDLTLAALLKSPLVGISEEQLFELAYGRGRTSLWKSLKNNDKFREKYEYLAALLNKTDFLSPFELYSHVIEAQGGRKKLAARLGTEVNDPIDEFLSIALDYERTHIPSLQGFLHWLMNGNTVIKRDLDQGNNEVRIMTVHGSKGLQAPVIFMPDTTSVPKNSNSILWSEDEISLPIWPARSANMDGFCRDIVEKNRKAGQDEYMRLLYVALTRAEDELYVTGYKDSNKLPEDCWYSLVYDAIEPVAENNDGILSLSSGQEEKVSNDNEAEKQPENISLPAFALSPKPEEPTPVVPLTPSKLEEDDSPVKSPLFGKSALRGKIIHKLLEYLPAVENNAREKAAQSFIRRYKKDFDDSQQNEILNSAFKVINDKNIAAIFSINSKAEVPITGIVGNNIISGQIDRLVVEDDYVLIVDYKTNRIPPKTIAEVHPAYIAQMSAYKAVMQDIYPKHEIRCALVWTEEPRVMFL